MGSSSTGWWAGLPLANRFGIIVFSSHILVQDLLIIAYVVTILIKRDNMYLQARNINLTLVHLAVHFFCNTLMAGRQVLSDAGLSMPCILMNAATFVGHIGALGTYFLRALHLTVVYDADQRRRFGMFTMKRGALLSMGFFIVQALMLLAATNPYKLCLSRCNVPNCFFASNYFFALPMTEIVGLVFPTVGKMLKALNVKDEVGVVLELNMASTIGHPVSWVFYTLIILMDTGVIHGIYWEWATTVATLCLFDNEFVWSHLLPSMRYGYAPWAILCTKPNPQPGNKPVAKVGPAEQQQGPQPRSITDDGQVALLFTDPELKGLFQEACRSFLVEESLLFLFTVQDLREEAESGSYSTLLPKCVSVVQTYVKPGSEYEINVSSNMARGCIAAIEAANGGPSGRRSSLKTAGPKPVWSTAPEGGGPTAEGDARALVRHFDSCYNEIRNMLLQNVLPRLEVQPDFQIAYGAWAAKHGVC